MKHYKMFLSDSHSNEKYEKGEYKYIVITFDLNGAESRKVYDEISKELLELGFRKYIQKRVKDKAEKSPYEFFDLPRNTYVAAAEGPKFHNINRLRDDAEKTVKDKLEPLLKCGEVEGFNYFVFVAKDWSWSCGRMWILNSEP